VVSPEPYLSNHSSNTLHAIPTAAATCPTFHPTFLFISRCFWWAPENALIPHWAQTLRTALWLTAAFWRNEGSSGWG